MSAATIARLKITLNDVKPTVLRRIEVPFDIQLDRLHLTIQAAMGWTNSQDPSQSLDQIMDVGFAAGKVAKIGADLAGVTVGRGKGSRFKADSHIPAGYSILLEFEEFVFEVVDADMVEERGASARIDVVAYSTSPVAMPVRFKAAQDRRRQTFGRRHASAILPTFAWE